MCFREIIKVMNLTKTQLYATDMSVDDTRALSTINGKGIEKC